jgi:post-segregation antitoxin (ccd killing protein)
MAVTTGPAAIVPDMINRAWIKATELSADASELTNDAVALTQPAPTAAMPDRVTAPTMPAAPTLPNLTTATASALYDATSVGVIDQLAGLYREFIDDNFADDSFINDAQSWVKKALTTGGAGINVAVEQQLWNRARDRALADAARAREALETDWAGRRFPMPPGALRHGLLAVDKSAQDAIAEAARTQATESFRTEVENARLAVERAVSLRSLAVQAAGEYVRLLSQGPSVAAQVSGTIIDSQTRFSAALTEFYRAQISAVEIPVRVATTNAELKARTTEANLRTAVETLGQRVNAVMANAQMISTQAAAAFNAVNVQASIAGSDQTITSIEG